MKHHLSIETADLDELPFNQIGGLGNGSPTRQFQIGDALLWTTVIRGALAAYRFVLTIDEDFPSQLRDIVIYTAKTTAVVLGAALLAFCTTRHLPGAIALMITVLLIGVLAAAPDASDSIQRMSRLT